MSLKRILAKIVLLAVLLMGCVAIHATESVFSNIPKEELERPPAGAPLPCGDGFIFSYNFSIDINERQAFTLLQLHMSIAKDQNVDFTDKVHILVFSGPQKVTFLTTDFKTKEIEFREEWMREDRFRMQVWRGEIDVLIEYLHKGYKGPVEVSEGKVSEEKPPLPPDPTNPCPSKTEI